MPLSFPSSPTTGQQSTQNGRVYAWSGSAWEFVATGGGEDTGLRAFFVPPAPTSVTATGGNAQAVVSWSAPTVLAQTPITDYVVQYSSNSGSTWTTFSDGTSTAASATVTGLTNGTAVQFRVAAVNGIGTGAYSTASAAVTPTLALPAISGLQLHLDAADASTLYDATTGGSLVAADGGVARWEDKSGNGRHATQSTSGNRPLRKTSVQGSKDVLRFDGSNDSLSIPSSTATFKFLHSADSTVFSVFKSGTTANPQQEAYALIYTFSGASAEVGYGIDTYDASPDNDAILCLACRGVQFTYTFTNNINNGFPSNTFALASFVTKPTDATAANRSSYRKNGGAAAANNTLTNSVSTANSQGDLAIGTRAVTPNYFLNGDIAEIIIYDSALSDTDRDSVEAYLMSKWGIT
jgi:hypothetical protein